MGQAVWPFLEYLVLQAAVAIVGLNMVRERELGISVCLKAWIFGQMLCFAVLQIMAVPMILMRWHFDSLFWSYIGVIGVLFSLGLSRMLKKKARIKIKIPNLKPFELLVLMITLLLILWQSTVYFFGMHLDEDDARWLAEANDALKTGDMMTRSYNTGEYVGSFVMPEDVTSPWPMLWAILSRIMFNTRVSVVSHTIFPPVEIIILYSIYWLIGKELLQKTEARLSFVLFAIFVTLFYGMTVYTQGTFTLVRIWQGKASVAGVAIPFILYLFICINKNNRLLDWLRLIITGGALCLMSGMGIIIGGIMIGVYGLYNIIAYRNWKRMFVWVISLTPSMVSLLINYYLRG